jgi:hypothetical protein
MHDSMKRLLEFVRSSTEGTKKPLREFADIAKAMGGLTPAVITNWKDRGISKDGALKAEEVFGCPATWLLSGSMPPIAVKGPDVMSQTAQLLQDIADVPELQRLRAVIAATRAVAAVKSGTRDGASTTTEKRRGGSQPMPALPPGRETEPR